MYKNLNINIQEKIDKYIIDYKKNDYNKLLKELEIINNEIEFREFINIIDDNDYKSNYYKKNNISSKILYLINNKNQKISKRLLYYIFSRPLIFKKIMLLNKYFKLKNYLPID